MSERALSSPSGSGAIEPVCIILVYSKTSLLFGRRMTARVRDPLYGSREKDEDEGLGDVMAS